MKWVHIYIVVFILCTAFLVLCQSYGILHWTTTYSITDGYIITWGDKLYFVSWSVWAACATTGVREFYKYYHDKRFVFFLILDFIMILAYGNLADELFFQPDKFQWAEYIGAIVGLLIVATRIVHRIVKQRK